LPRPVAPHFTILTVCHLAALVRLAHCLMRSVGAAALLAV